MMEHVKPADIKVGERILCNGRWLEVLAIETPPDFRGCRGTRIFELEEHGRYEAGYLFQVVRHG